MSPRDAVRALDDLGASDCAERLRHCCGSTRWVEAMVAARPFETLERSSDLATRIWWGLGRDDWLEAFNAHPRIGDLDALRQRYAAQDKRWSQGEQGAVAGAAESVLEALAEGNRVYEERFGHLFIVCATGKGAEDMLAILQRRLANDPDDEWNIAAGEQLAITHLRLEKLLREVTNHE